MNRLFWAGHESAGGILCVAVSALHAIRLAHGDDATYPDDGWSATDIEGALPGWRIALVLRAPEQYDVVRLAGSTRLWWAYAEDGPGEWYAVRHREEAVEEFVTAHREQRGRIGLYVDEIRCVDGYEVLLVRETMGAVELRREAEEAIG